MKRLNIGCGNNILDGYINVDIRNMKPKRLFGNKFESTIYPDEKIKNLLIDFFDSYPSIYPLRKDLFTNNIVELLYHGLGDAVIMTSLPKQAHEVNRKLRIYSNNNKYISELLKFNEYHEVTTSEDIENEIPNSEFFLNNWGGGHQIQLMEKALGLPVQLKPKGYINKKVNKIKNKIAIGIEPPHTRIQRALDVYEMRIIQKFIDSNSDKYQFVEIGLGPELFIGVEKRSFENMEALIDELGSCEYFIGTASGLMNLAAALDVKSIILANVPDVNLFYLPCLATNNGIRELSWMYPQNVHLHLDDENELVKKFSYDNLLKALAGEIYPYWREDYLPLVFEYDKLIMDRLENSFLQADAESLPFEEESFDEIQAIDVFEHISYRKSKEVLKHWISLLKPGGVIYIQAPSLTTILEYLMRARTLSDVESAIALLYGGQDYPENYHKTVCDVSLLANYLQEAGITRDIQYQILGTNLKIRAFK